MPEHVCHCSVKIEELSVRKGSTEILNQVNLTANHGEILALIGRNGAGKTTLLKDALYRPDHVFQLPGQRDHAA